MNEQLDKINLFITRLDTDTQAGLNHISKSQAYKKGEILLRQGEICKYSFWIEKGIVRKYYLNDGKEITTELLFENDIAVSFQSYTLQKPSNEIIQVIADTTVSKMEYKSFQQAKLEFPKLMQLDLLMTEYYALWLEKRLFEFSTLDATQRYLLLM
ncbi:MAG: Crp/Fnr family transcriptional regulator [Microscillaceae bacterium]|jgi:CRP-like cAMP-binding protein|nr:Crp/Fnr family transcriptional regulator [Microscillaceae bacterium]